MDYQGSKKPRISKGPRKTVKSKGGKKKTGILQNKMPQTIANGKYRVGQKVGKGAFGAVYKCYNTEDGSVVAVKTVSTKNMSGQRLNQIMQEVELLKELDEHRNIVRYIDSQRGSGFLFIVLEFVENGSLQAFMKNFDGKLPERLVALYTFQILLGLKFLHSEGIIHRDIKAANILLTNTGVAKLTDFGVAVRDKGEGDKNFSNLEEDVAGSPYWMAPEVIEMSGQVTTACDIWGVGATAIELFTGKPPYFNLLPMPALFRIVQDKHPPFPSGISSQFEQFLYQCFNKDANMRATAKELATKSPWFKKKLSETDYNQLEFKSNTKKNNKKRKSKSISKTEPGMDNNSNKNDNSDSDSSDWDDNSDDNKSDNGNGNTIDMTQTFKIAKQDYQQIIQENILQKQQKKKNKEKNKKNKKNKKNINIISNELPMSPLDESKSDTDNNSGEDSWSSSSDNNNNTNNDPINKGAPDKITNTNINDIISNNNNSKSRLLSPGKNTVDNLLHNSSQIEGGGDLARFKDDDDDDDWGEDVDVDLNTLNNNKPQYSSDDDDEDDDDWTDDDDDILDNLEEMASKNWSSSLKKLDELITDSGSNNLENLKIDDVKQTFGEIEKLYLEKPVLLDDIIKFAVIPIMEILQSRNVEVIRIVTSTLEVLLNDKKNGKRFGEALCLVQFVPELGGLVNNDNILLHSLAIPFLKRLCDEKLSSDFTRKMFIASGGLNILANCLKRKYNNDNKPLIFAAVDCIEKIFFSRLHNKRDLSRMFTKAKLLYVLMKRFSDTITDEEDEEEAKKYGEKMALIFFRIAEIPDRVIKRSISKTGKKSGRGVLDAILGALPTLENDLKANGKRKKILILILKGLVELSRNADGIQALMEHKTVASVCPFLYNNDIEIQTHIIMIFFYVTLVQLNDQLSATEEAAKNGAIPRLQELFKSKHQSMYFLVLTISKFTKSASRDTLYELKKHNMVQFYLDMTKSDSTLTVINGLIALSQWIQYEDYTPLLEFILCRPDNITQLISVFGLPVSFRMKLLKNKTKNKNKNGETFDEQKENKNKKKKYKKKTYSQHIPIILDAFNKLSSSKRIAQEFGSSDLFLRILGEWLHSTTDESFDKSMTKNLLQMVQSLFYNLESIVQKKFVQIILPVLDDILQQKTQKNIIRAQIKMYLVKYMFIHADDDTLNNLTQYTRNIITEYSNKQKIN